MVTLDLLLILQPLNNGTPLEKEGIIEGTLITGSHVFNNCCSRSREMVLLIDADAMSVLRLTVLIDFIRFGSGSVDFAVKSRGFESIKMFDISRCLIFEATFPLSSGNCNAM